jgi:hypothetical protein
MLEITDLPGLWRRSLIVRADGSRDTTTWVRWLQGPSDYADLRQPAGRPDFGGVGYLRQLTRKQLGWMALQDGFAGKLLLADDIFEWRRDIDFQPPGSTPDRGRLIRDGDTMIEEGYDRPYIEHWHPAAEAAAPTYALRLRDAVNGCMGHIVRVGALFMYARGRAVSLPSADDLAACLALAGSLSEAQDMVDCEVSFGTVTGAGWTITHSSLPFREGQRLDMQLTADMGRVQASDLTADGRPMRRSWNIVAAEGEAA